MRKVKNNISTGNPALMFAQGVESIVSDQWHNPSRYDDEELQKLQRKANRQDSRGNLFNSLMRQFGNY